MNTKTRTVITDGRQEAGPFESEEAAWSAMLHPFSSILSVEHRTDGWYTVYVITTTTSTTTLRALDAEMLARARECFNSVPTREG